MVNVRFASDSPDFQPSAVTKRDNGTMVRFDDWSHASYFLDMSEPELENAAPGKELSEAAKRALREAAERRKAEADIADATSDPANSETEINGPSGEEPTRFGDWERGGIAYDF